MDLKKEINLLKTEKNALILAHYYQRPEIQEIADYVGDSYYLSKIAKDSPNKLIVFCGVKSSIRIHEESVSLFMQ